MRQRDASEELPAPREAVPREPAPRARADEVEPPAPQPDRRGAWEHGPQTPADRVAARRRLDRQADRWW